jgi:hypothetical protein
MTALASTGTPFGGDLFGVFYLYRPSAGNESIVASQSANPNGYLSFTAFSIFCASGFSFEDTVTNDALSYTPSNNVSAGTAGRIVVQCVCMADGDTVSSWGANETQIAALSPHVIAAAYAITGQAITMSAQLQNNDNWGSISFGLNDVEFFGSVSDSGTGADQGTAVGNINTAALDYGHGVDTVTAALTGVGTPSYVTMFGSTLILPHITDISHQNSRVLTERNVPGAMKAYRRDLSNLGHTVTVTGWQVFTDPVSAYLFMETLYRYVDGVARVFNLGDGSIAFLGFACDPKFIFQAGDVLTARYWVTYSMTFTEAG